jgi:hypothetical protein
MLRTLLATGHLVYIPPTPNEKEVKLRYGLAIAAGTTGYMLWQYMGFSNWSEFYSFVGSKLV